MGNNIWIIIAFLSGAFLPIQAGVNTRLGYAAGSPAFASLISFLVGTIALVIYVLVTNQPMSWAGLRTAPVQLWTGGLMGAFYVTVIILAFPKIGPGLTFGLIVAGQMIMSVVLDHYRILVIHQQPISLMRILGVVMIIAGAVLIRKF